MTGLMLSGEILGYQQNEEQKPNFQQKYYEMHNTLNFQNQLLSPVKDIKFLRQVIWQKYSQFRGQ